MNFEKAESSNFEYFHKFNSALFNRHMYPIRTFVCLPLFHYYDFAWLSFPYLKVAPYSFMCVSRKFCPRARLVVLQATRVVDVARVAGFFKLRRDIHVGKAFVGLSAGRERKLKSWFLRRHKDENKYIFLVLPSVKCLKTSHTFL
jgi:hypothetical protein